MYLSCIFYSSIGVSRPVNFLHTNSIYFSSSHQPMHFFQFSFYLTYVKKNPRTPRFRSLVGDPLTDTARRSSTGAHLGEPGIAVIFLVGRVIFLNNTFFEILFFYFFILFYFFSLMFKLSFIMNRLSKCDSNEFMRPC